LSDKILVTGLQKPISDLFAIHTIRIGVTGFGLNKGFIVAFSTFDLTRIPARDALGLAEYVLAT